MDINQWYDAIDYNETEKIMKMINNGFDVTVDNDYAFRRAAYYGNLELMQLLLEHGANINASKSYALRRSVYDRNVDNVKFLIKSGANIHKNCLNIVIDNGETIEDDEKENDLKNLKIIKILVKNGAELDTGNNDLISMILLMEKPDYEYIEYLIEKGLVIYPYFDVLSLDMVAERPYIIELLLKNGLDVNDLLSLVIMSENYDLLEMLFEFGADMEKVNFDDVMEVYCDNYSCGYKFPKNVAKILIKNGLPKNIIQRMHNISNGAGDYEIAEYLEKYL